MTAHAAEFFTLDEVNRLNVIQDAIGWHLTTPMAAQCLSISDPASADAFCRVTVKLIRLVWLIAVVENPAITSCLMALHSTRSVLFEIAIATSGRRWRVRNSQNCTMFTCPKRLSVHSWSKPVSGSPANNVRRKFSSHVIAGPAAAN